MADVRKFKRDGCLTAAEPVEVIESVFFLDVFLNLKSLVGQYAALRPSSTERIVEKEVCIGC